MNGNKRIDEVKVLFNRKCLFISMNYYELNFKNYYLIFLLSLQISFKALALSKREIYVNPQSFFNCSLTNNGTKKNTELNKQTVNIKAADFRQYDHAH